MNKTVSRRRDWLTWGLGALVVVLIAILILGRGIGDKDDASKEADRETAAATSQQRTTIGGLSLVKIDPDAQRRSGIQTTAVSIESGREPVRAFAAVLDVTQLTDLRNSALNAQVQVTSDAAKLAATKAALERAQALYQDSQNVSLAVLQAAQASYAADKAALAAAQAQATTFSATAGQEFGPVVGDLRSGLVADLIQRRRVLLQITAPDAPISAPPASVTVQTDAGRSVEARLVSPAARTDPKIQGASFYYVAPASGGLLPGMNVLALLPGSGGRSGGVVPQSAVVYWQGQTWAYQRKAEDAFQRIPVSTDTPAAQGGYIVQGLAPGAQLVTRGAQLLLSEELRPQAQGASGDPDGGND
ncbi:MAG: efflux RND transporter periplasmic adaptor subunit [Caulobacteraceae bacterium]